MPGASSQTIIGNQPVYLGYLPDTVERNQQGTILTGVEDYWGGSEVIYGRAAGTIRSMGLCVVTQTLTGGAWRWDFSEVPNTANLGRAVYVAMAPMTVGQFGWFVRTGIVPVNCNASVAADTTFGIAAAGQGGANSAGKQVLNARVIAAASTTVVKLASANNASNQLRIPSADGWFIGVFLSGTGIAAGTTVTAISDDGTMATLSANTTAAVNGNVTGTYNNGTIFYNVAHIDRPIAQGAIT